MNTETTSIGTLETGASKYTETSEARSRVKLVVNVTMALWLVAIFLLGAGGAFLRGPGLPPLPILLGVTLPLLVFFAAYFALSAFKSFVLTADLRLATAIQGWRVAGLGFLALYAHGILPGLFAWPAGLGDIAVGLTAPWIALELTRQPGFAATRRYAVWNLLGITDLIIAVSMGGLTSGFLPKLAGTVTTTPMTQLPLILIPAYLVPFFIMLHFTALAQARRLTIREQPAGARNP